MFQWYSQSAICLAYLSDVDANTLSTGPTPEAKWFSRGWTLQELVASPKIRFYNERWQFIGDKVSLSNQLASMTGIDRQLLEAANKPDIIRRLAQIPVCQKMSWVSERETTRIEDTAYCLLGIFDIHMPLLYGEREAAFIRLQEAIAAKYNDLTLFAWTAKGTHPQHHTSKNVVFYNRNSGAIGSVPESDPGSNYECYHGIFACSPKEFARTGGINSCVSHPSIYNPEFSITNKGLKINSALRKSSPFGYYVMPLMCSIYAQTTHVTPEVKNLDAEASQATTGQPLGILLKWIGGSTYARHDVCSLWLVDSGHSQGQDDFYLATSLEHPHRTTSDLYRWSIGIPHTVNIHAPQVENESRWEDSLLQTLELTQVSPSSMWDEEKSIFVTFGHQNPIGCASYSLAGSDHFLFILLFGINRNGKPWLCLEKNGSPLSPFYVERRREYLTRVALDAERISTHALQVPLALEDLPGIPRAEVHLTIDASFTDGHGKSFYDIVLLITAAQDAEVFPPAPGSTWGPVNPFSFTTFPPNRYLDTQIQPQSDVPRCHIGVARSRHPTSLRITRQSSNYKDKECKEATAK